MPEVNDWVERDQFIARITADDTDGPYTIKVYEVGPGGERATGDEDTAKTHKAARDAATDLLAATATGKAAAAKK